MQLFYHMLCLNFSFLKLWNELNAAYLSFSKIKDTHNKIKDTHNKTCVGTESFRLGTEATSVW